MTPRCYHAYAIIAHPTEPRVLALPAGTGWALPAFTADDLRFNDTPAINERMGECVGTDVNTLGVISFWREELDGVSHRHFVYAMALRDGAVRPTGAWMSPGDLSLAPARLDQALHNWLAERDKVSPRRAPWSYAGWFERTSERIDAQLADHGVERAGPVVQQRVWSLTAVLRAPTDQGDVYMKAVPPMFGREPALTDHLARQYEDELPPLLAIDAAQGWLLMRDFQARTLSKCDDHAVWEAAIRRYAELQIEQIGQTDALLTVGCADRRLEVLERQIEPLLDSLPTLSADYVTDDDLSRFRAAVPRLRDLIRDLAAGPVPPSLMHGDFHANNLAVKPDGGILYFDWTDGCIAHPFFDLIIFLHDSAEYYESFGWPDDAKARLEAAYLEPWIVIAPIETLRHLLALAYPVALLHQAVSYQGILEALEPGARWQFDFAPPDYLSSMLHHLPA